MHAHFAPWLQLPQLPEGVTYSQGDEPPLETTHLIDGGPKVAHLDLPNLQAVIVPWAGINPTLAEGIRARPHLKLYNLHVNGTSVAELALGLLLSVARGIAAGDQAMRSGTWEVPKAAFPNAKLRGMTACLLGYGSIGKALEPMLLGLGMKTVKVRRRPGEHEYNLDQLLLATKQSNVLIISVPLSPTTAGCVNLEVLRSLLWPRIVINVGRGAHVVEQDLYQFLMDGEGYAGVDVWYRYPSDRAAGEPHYPSDLPFHELPNVVLSPHRAGSTHVAEEERTEGIAQLLTGLLRGDAIEPVDPDVG